MTFLVSGGVVSGEAGVGVGDLVYVLQVKFDLTQVLCLLALRDKGN